MAYQSTGTRVGSTSTSSAPSPPRRRSRHADPPAEQREAAIAPAKSLGQHFLIDSAIVDQIIAAAAPGGVVVEVGPGLGALTERLATLATHLIAVELDPRLCQRLHQRFDATANLTIVEADVLATDPAGLLTAAGLDAATEYGVVGNLPYNIGSAILRHFLEAARPPSSLTVMLQREVAEAVCADPGELGILGIASQVYAQASLLFSVPARAFYPPPKVTSSVIRLDVRPQPLVPAAERDDFFAVVRAGFSAPRKQVRNSLAQGLRRPPAEVEAALRAEGLDPTLRPADLSIAAWRRLALRLGA